ncbi:hypothetical protein C1752_13686 [Acaryochloris thomasi RCC1774]|uniref:Uncharacterized protein n=1 Tax=Acaryochloris thomasi RCC1774 TaxID=1764569 RepID=A0A2W1J7B2_9CYAN|nr:hypothetical protein C1752_13686 [Acaryochloris thomasi RCC1774]
MPDLKFAQDKAEEDIAEIYPSLGLRFLLGLKYEECSIAYFL